MSLGVLVAKLDEVFPREKDFEELIQGDVCLDDEFSVDIDQVLSGKQWHEVGCEDILYKLPEVSIVMKVLTPKAYAYYLPSFVKCSLVQEAPDFALAIEWLLPPSQKFELRENMKAWWLQFRRSLSHDQFSFISEFLHYVQRLQACDGGVASVRCSIALKNYWGEYQQ